jgi:hypothetical protein
MPRRAIVSTVQIAAKLPPIMSDLGLVVPDVAPLPPAIVGKHGSRAQSISKSTPAIVRFISLVLLRVPRILLNGNPTIGLELRKQELIRLSFLRQPFWAAYVRYGAQIRAVGLTLFKLQNHPITKLPDPH